MTTSHEVGGIDPVTLKFEMEQFELNNTTSIHTILTGGNIIYSGRSTEFLELKNNLFMNDTLQSAALLNFGNFLEDVGGIQMLHERIGTDTEDDNATYLNILVTKFSLRDFSNFLKEYNNLTNSNLTLADTIRGYIEA